MAAISETIGQYFEPRNYLVCADIGTGSGAIALALKSAFPHWVMLASDVSPEALAVAKRNFAAAGKQVTTYEGDALEPYIASQTALDILVSNPPYIRNPDDAQLSVTRYEPALAWRLDPAHNVYEAIVKNCHRVKKGSLFMAFEISPDLEESLASMIKAELPDSHWWFQKDLNGFVRFLFVYLP